MLCEGARWEKFAHHIFFCLYLCFFKMFCIRTVTAREKAFCYLAFIVRWTQLWCSCYSLGGGSQVPPRQCPVVSRSWDGQCYREQWNPLSFQEVSLNRILPLTGPYFWQLDCSEQLFLWSEHFHKLYLIKLIQALQLH